MALSWTPVTTLTNHAGLTDLTGYRLTYGPTGASAGQLSTLEPAGTTQLTLPLPKGQWSFTVAAVSASHGVGLPSNTVTKSIQ